MSKKAIKLQEELEELKGQIKKESENDTNLKKYAKKHNVGMDFELGLKSRRTLKGHAAKVYEFDFCQSQPDCLVSCSQDGKMIVWNGLSTHKLFIIPLKSPWVLTCAYAPGGQAVASAGLDNILYTYNLNDEEFMPTDAIEFRGHEGSISRCRYVDDERIISGGGDHTAILWSVEGQSVTTQFYGHTNDILSLDVHPEKNTFLTGSIDCTARLWDIRTGEAELSFSGHTADINTVKFFPGSNAFGTGSDDGTVKLFDLRGDRELMTYHQHGDEGDPYRIISLSFSHSGKYIFAACHTWTLIWNTVSGEKIDELEQGNIVSCVSVNPNGEALYSSCWNNYIEVYA